MMCFLTHPIQRCGVADIPLDRPIAHAPPVWHGFTNPVREMVIAVRGRCGRGYGTLATCWKALVMLSKMGITIKQKGLVRLHIEGTEVQHVDADALLTHIGLNLHAFWNHRGHARHVQGRRRALMAVPLPDRTAHDALSLWLLELIMDSGLPPDEMDVLAGEEYGTHEIARHLLYKAGIVAVVEFLGLKNGRARTMISRKKASLKRVT
jgi:hypothetical protein